MRRGGSEERPLALGKDSKGATRASLSRKNASIAASRIFFKGGGGGVGQGTSTVAIQNSLEKENWRRGGESRVTLIVLNRGEVVLALRKKKKMASCRRTKYDGWKRKRKKPGKRRVEGIKLLQKKEKRRVQRLGFSTSGEETEVGPNEHNRPVGPNFSSGEKGHEKAQIKAKCKSGGVGER